VKWAALAVPLALLSASGCGSGTEPSSATGAGRQVAATVGRLERASANGDWRTVCDSLFTASARRRAGGSACARLLRSDAGSIARPRIRVLKITLKGHGRALARVQSRASGQPPLDDTIALQREGGAYRIDSLSG
jgi:hypothetical protein